MDSLWPAVQSEQRIWTPSREVRVPRRDRNVIYHVSLPALIAHAVPPLQAPMAAAVERATLVLARLDAAEGLDVSIAPLLRTESAASSKIEQIEVAQRHVGRALEGLPAKRSASEVAANVRALRTAVETADRDVTPQSFHDIHAILMAGEPDAGRPRERQNWVGGSDYSPRGARYVPPPPERVPGLLDDLAAFMGRQDLPALTQAAIAHAQFECIHPYADGNGRTSRALLHVLLRRRGVVRHGIAPLSLALLANRERYFDGLVHYQQGDVEQWVSQFAEAAERAAKAGRDLASGLSAVRGEWDALPAISAARAGSTVRRLVADLTAHPVMDSGQVAQRYGVSTVAARNALNALEAAGVLRSVSASRGHRIWEAHEVFAALDDTERAMLRDA